MADDTKTPRPAVQWYRHLGWRGLIFPTLVVLVLSVVVAGKVLHTPDTKTVAAESAQASREAAAAAVAQALARTATTVTTPPAPIPAYDYLSCTHVAAGDPTPCAPLLVWPLTEGAKALIGLQQGGIKGELSTVKTRIVADQIRQLGVGVDACTLWLGIVRDAAMNSVLTVYVGQANAPQGAAKLCDCTPSARGPQGTIPTDGTS